MGVDLSDCLALGSAAAVTLAATPVMIVVARRTDFFDRPREYRQHARATPLLGGAAVLVGFGVAAALGGGVAGRGVMLACATAMWVLGTVDDRIAVSPWWRLLLEAAAGAALYGAGLGWSTGAGSAVNLALTLVWVAGLINAFNLMDNMDGACATVGSVAALSIAGLAALRGQTGLAVLACALSGACAGFLPWNLRGPARIFLGDGGSMLIGCLIAALGMAVARHSASGNAGPLVGAMLVGLPILDVALVSISRSRREVSWMAGGRDHLTHRLALTLGSPRRVVAALAVGEAVLGALAITGYALGAEAVAIFGALAAATGGLSIAWLDRPNRRPSGIAHGPRQRPAIPVHAESR